MIASYRKLESREAALNKQSNGDDLLRKTKEMNILLRKLEDFKIQFGAGADFYRAKMTINKGIKHASDSLYDSSNFIKEEWEASGAQMLHILNEYYSRNDDLHLTAPKEERNSGCPVHAQSVISRF